MEEGRNLDVIKFELKRMREIQTGNGRLDT
jgi:hypothetical protein